MDAAAARQRFVGMRIDQLPTPAAIVNRRIVAAHCQEMLDVSRDLGIGLRVHIKTHKIGEAVDTPALLIVSTLPEIALLLPWLLQAEATGRKVNVLYSMPLPPSSVTALDKYAEAFCSPGSISVMVDHPAHLAQLPRFTRPASVFLKIDTGTHRAGLSVGSPKFAHLVSETLASHESGNCTFLGIYSHASHSYAARDAENAMCHLQEEIDGCLAAERVVRNDPKHAVLKAPLILSVGASPTARSAQNLMRGVRAGETTAAQHLRTRLASLREEKEQHRLEFHAGVYLFLDLQQLSTQAAPSTPAIAKENSSSSLAVSDVAFMVMAEVTSTYAHRDPPQALIAAGSLALGREPCPRYSGFGAISNWGLKSQPHQAQTTGWAGPNRSGWVVAKISQEHGILMREEATGWEGSVEGEARESEVPFAVGQKVLVLPNHACIAGAGYPWYFVVDGSDEVVDIWARCDGW